MPVKSFLCGFCAFSWQKLSVVIACLSVFTAQAELKWDTTVAALKIHPLQVEERAEFRFINDGTEPVEILSVKSTCGCLKASASTNRIAPGESGCVVVVFDFRDKMGPQRKGVAVRSSDNPKQPVILYVEANIPEVYTVSSKRLEWNLSGNREPQSCLLVNSLTEPVRLISVSSSSESFTAELITVREGFEYEVRVQPVESATAGLAVITVQTECPTGLTESRTYSFNASLR
jgi:hypothetical protein